MEKIINPWNAKVFGNYSPRIRQKLMHLRQLIMDTASEYKLSDMLEETLKWGETSYLVKTGSTIRIDWESARHGQYAIISIARPA